MKFKDRHNAMFVGLAPAKNPVIAVSVIGEHACHGSSGAAPIGRAIIKKYLEKYFPDVYGEKVLAARLKSMGQPVAMPKTPKALEVEDEGFVDSSGEDLVAPEERVPQVPAIPPPVPMIPVETTNLRADPVANEPTDD
jgi:hypothetical protein